MGTLRAKSHIAASICFLISAFTISAAADTIVVGKTADTNNPLPCSNCSLREAVTSMNFSPFTGIDTVIIAIPPNDPGCNTITHVCTLTLTLGFDIQITSPASEVVIDGGIANRTTIDGGAGFNRIFTIISGATVKNVTLQGGNGASGFSTGSGSAIYMGAFGGSLTLDSVVVQNNDSTALTNGTASVSIFGGVNHRIINSTIANNSGKFCGGLEFQGGTTSALSIV
ncbi:MAG TPA: hypothetical protein VK468_10005, partial [Pyrinomonadaceae bacterium]|nr:hypothetical protein [Pyrinomonadaceae bacterium]